MVDDQLIRLIELNLSNKSDLLKSAAYQQISRLPSLTEGIKSFVKNDILKKMRDREAIKKRSEIVIYLSKLADSDELLTFFTLLVSWYRFNIYIAIFYIILCVATLRLSEYRSLGEPIKIILILAPTALVLWPLSILIFSKKEGERFKKIIDIVLAIASYIIIALLVIVISILREYANISIFLLMIMLGVLIYLVIWNFSMSSTILYINKLTLLSFFQVIISPIYLPYKLISNEISKGLNKVGDFVEYANYFLKSAFLF